MQLLFYIASRLSFAIGVKDLQIMMAKRAVAAQKQLSFSKISDGTALHVPLNLFGSISRASQFRFPGTTAIFPDGM